MDKSEKTKKGYAHLFHSCFSFSFLHFLVFHGINGTNTFIIFILTNNKYMSKRRNIMKVTLNRASFMQELQTVQRAISK